MKKILITVLLASGVSFAHAEQTQADPKLTEKMFQVMGVDKQIAGGFEAMMPMIDQLSMQFQLDAAGKEELKNIYREWFDKDLDRASMKKQLADIYAKTFTTQEIEQLIEFYSTPIGKKYIEKSPELARLGAEIGMKEAQAKEQQLMDKLQPFLKKVRQNKP